MDFLVKMTKSKPIFMIFINNNNKNYLIMKFSHFLSSFPRESERERSKEWMTNFSLKIWNVNPMLSIIIRKMTKQNCVTVIIHPGALLKHFFVDLFDLIMNEQNWNLIAQTRIIIMMQCNCRFITLLLRQIRYLLLPHYHFSNEDAHIINYDQKKSERWSFFLVQ